MRDTVLVISAALALVDAWLVVRVMRFLGGPQQVFGAQVEGRVGHGLATMGSPFDWKMLGRGLVGIPGGYAVVGVFDPIAVSAHRLASILADLETRSPWPVPYVPAVVMTGKDADRFARDRLKHPGPCVVMAARARN